MENVNDNKTTHTAIKGRYVGPTAARIAELIATHGRVRFERGWFWTVAVCHGSEQDLLAFRQRPDGDGIDVRCHRVGARGRQSAGCSRERIIRRLERAAGESIWSAYTSEPRPSTTQAPASADQTGESDGTRAPSWRLGVVPFIVLLLAAPLVLGYDLQVVALNAVGLAWTAWLARRVLRDRRRAVAKGGRPR